jgi:hypothetical protein
LNTSENISNAFISFFTAFSVSLDIFASLSDFLRPEAFFLFCRIIYRLAVYRVPRTSKNEKGAFYRPERL